MERFLCAAHEQLQAALAQHGEAAAEVLARHWNVPLLHVRRLQQRGGRYWPILRLVLTGCSHQETANQLGLTRREVELCVGYIEDFLHARRFAESFAG